MFFFVVDRCSFSKLFSALFNNRFSRKSDRKSQNRCRRRRVAFMLSIRFAVHNLSYIFAHSFELSFGRRNVSETGRARRISAGRKAKMTPDLSKRLISLQTKPGGRKVRKQK